MAMLPFLNGSMRDTCTASAVFLALLLALAGPAAAQESPLLERAGMSRAKGQQAAKVVVLELADFQCPYCGQFALNVYPRIDSAYVKTGKIQWVFVNMPLHIHQNAWVASEAAMCAGGAGSAFWAMHDRLFTQQAEWSGISDPAAVAAVLRKYAQQAGVPLEAFDSCVADDRVSVLLLRDLMYASSLQITGTPAFVINNDQKIVGLKSFEEWKPLLDAAIAKAAK